MQESSALGTERPLLLAVTILTSTDQDTMNQQMNIPGDIAAQTGRLASLAEEAGLDGIIASPHEVRAIRQAVSRDKLIVTPGVRPSWAAAHDQRRVMTPGQAILEGASYIVVGRPITKPPQGIGTPADAADRIAEEISLALKSGGG